MSMATDGKVSVHVGVCLPVSVYLGVFVTTKTDAHQCIFQFQVHLGYDEVLCFFLPQTSIRAFCRSTFVDIYVKYLFRSHFLHPFLKN